MAEVTEVILDWNVANGRGGVSVLNFLGEATPVVIRNEIEENFSNAAGELAIGTQVTIRQEGRVIEDTTGTLLREWNDPRPKVVNGLGSSSPVPNSSQVLVRLNTTTVVDGRLRKGRVFIPGVPLKASSPGEVDPATQETWANVFESIRVPTGLAVYSRPRVANPEADPPVTARVGGATQVTGVSVWNEFAVLRRRR